MGERGDIAQFDKSVEIPSTPIDSDGPMDIYEIRNEMGEPIGTFCLTLEGDEANIESVNIKEQFRGQGYGKMAYKKMIELLGPQNIKLVSDGNFLTEPPAKIWEGLVEEGKATKKRFWQNGKYESK
ncbi:GNAT family N-acetyltransferase [bacterium]|nr:MAG: GNAT family N-acetyltransferase [bacterium]